MQCVVLTVEIHFIFKMTIQNDNSLIQNDNSLQVTYEKNMINLSSYIYVKVQFLSMGPIPVTVQKTVRELTQYHKKQWTDVQPREFIFFLSNYIIKISLSFHCVSN